MMADKALKYICFSFTLKINFKEFDFLNSAWFSIVHDH